MQDSASLKPCLMHVSSCQLLPVLNPIDILGCESLMLGAKFLLAKKNRSLEEKLVKQNILARTFHCFEQ